MIDNSKKRVLETKMLADSVLFFHSLGMTLFVPVTILELVAKMKVFDKWCGTVFFSLIVSVLIELVQCFKAVNGLSDLVAVDIVDVMTNTIGGQTGWLIFRLHQKNHI